MKKKCAVCDFEINLNNEEVIASSIKYPNVNYCLCEKCGDINVECSSNAPLIALDQVISDAMQKDAEESIMKKILPESYDIMAMLSDFCDELKRNKESNQNKDNKESKDNTVKVAKIKHETKHRDRQRPYRPSRENSSIVNKEKCNKSEQPKEVAFIAYRDNSIIEEFTNDVSLSEAFEMLVNRYGIDDIRTNKIKLFELNQIKPKIKETVKYELDI